MCGVSCEIVILVCFLYIRCNLHRCRGQKQNIFCLIQDRSNGTSIEPRLTRFVKVIDATIISLDPIMFLFVGSHNPHDNIWVLSVHNQGFVLSCLFKCLFYHHVFYVSFFLKISRGMHKLNNIMYLYCKCYIPYVQYVVILGSWKFTVCDRFQYWASSLSHVRTINTS